MLLVVLPLRVPVAPENPIFSQLSQWIQADNLAAKQVDLRLSECSVDIRRLESLRLEVSNSLHSFDFALEKIEQLHEYAAVLHAFELRGFHTNTLDLPWRIGPAGSASGLGLNASNINENDKGSEYRSMQCIQSQGSLTWERANIIFNLVSLEAYQATLEPLNSKMAWNKAGIHLQNAASLVQYLRAYLQQQQGQLNDISRHSMTSATTPPTTTIISDALLKTWQDFLLAEAQRAAYHTLAAAARPRAFMLAKLAAAAAPLYQRAETTALTMDDKDMPISTWPDIMRAWNMWMAALTEFHQSLVHRERAEWGMELARLDGAIRFGTFCADYCESIASEGSDNGIEHADTDIESGEGLPQNVREQMQDMQDRWQHAEEENTTKHHLEVPDRDDLPDVPPQVTVKMQEDVTKVLPAQPQQPIFQNIMDPAARAYVEEFQEDVEQLLQTWTERAEEKTERGRQALATVHLPHSLTAYRQEAAGGGIPEDLWERVFEHQKAGGEDRIQQEFWELKELAETARGVFDDITCQLEKDLRSDQQFREQQQAFTGHNVTDVQKTFRLALQKYDRLIRSAQESDSLLHSRSSILDSDAKFNLLRLQRSQLDRLMPGSSANANIDVANLSQHLVDLSNLFHEREILMMTIKKRINKVDIAAEMATVPAGRGAEQEYQSILEDTKESFQPMFNEMEGSFDHQTQLLHKILKENEAFVLSREAANQNIAHTDTYILKIEDALEEMDTFSKHLKEGRDFYDVIIPKLRKLQHQITDVSARLAAERCDYEDSTRRTRQEAEDARMAASLSSLHRESMTSAPSGGFMNESESQERQNGYYSRGQREQEQSRQPAHPGVESVPHDAPDVRVDDEMVANLVDMDFDPDRVVAALKKYDNNLNQALNELLSG